MLTRIRGPPKYFPWQQQDTPTQTLILITNEPASDSALTGSVFRIRPLPSRGAGVLFSDAGRLRG
jgi:hypothetical protein